MPGTGGHKGRRTHGGHDNHRLRGSRRLPLPLHRVGVGVPLPGTPTPTPRPRGLGGPELSVLERFDGVGHPVAPQVARSVDQDDLRTLGATILRARIAGDGETLQVLINTARPMDLLDGLMISAESLAFVVAKQRECSALEVAESLHYAAVDMFLGKGNPDDND